jgi:UPF0755 protein
MRKKRLYILLGVLIFIAVVLLGGLVWWKGNISAVSDIDEKISFIIPKGRSAMQVANKLFDEGLIKSPLAFKIYVQVSGKSQNINAGEFSLSKNMTLQEIIEALGKGPMELWVTIPEGLRREEIVEKLTEGLGLSGEEAKTFAESFLEASEGKEGYLFPDTYLFPRDVSAGLVVDKMLQNFNIKVNEDMMVRIENSQYTLNDYVIMASIIERETKTDEERPIVAGILWKRLETSGWLIQADATVQYGVGNANCRDKTLTCEDWWPTLTLEDLETPSLYNSYTTNLLPPTPIANPGLSSLKASIFSEPSDYWFYIHDPEGNIHYAKDISGHNRNVRVYLGK